MAFDFSPAKTALLSLPIISRDTKRPDLLLPIYFGIGISFCRDVFTRFTSGEKILKVSQKTVDSLDRI